MPDKCLDGLRSMRAQVGDLSIHACSANDSTARGLTPIVLVHGFGLSCRYMEPLARLLARVRPVFALDLPGSGRSSAPSHALTLPELADFLADWMTAIGVDRAVLLGNSFGCQIIAEFAVRHPARIERAVLVSPTVDPAARSAFQLLSRLLLDTAHERPSQIVIAVIDYCRFGMRRAYATLRIMQEDRIEQKLPLMTMPTLVVRGERDPIVTQPWVERVTALLPAGQLVVIPGTGHAVNYDVPERLAEVVTRFLSH